MNAWNGVAALIALAVIALSVAALAMLVGSVLRDALEWLSERRTALSSLRRWRPAGAIVLVVCVGLGAGLVGIMGARERSTFIQHVSRYGFVMERRSLDAMRTFSEGYAAALKDGRWGYVNEEGRVVIDFEYIDAREFSEGLAAVQTLQGWGYVDASGRIVIAPHLAAARVFSEGLAPACNGTFWGYLDRSGSWHIAPQFVLASPFRGGKALVTTQDMQIIPVDKAGRPL